VIDAAELELLRASQADHRVLDVAVNACAYSCCGRGWKRRDGYEQLYRGYVDNLQEPEDGAAGTFMLYAVGIGTISYVIAVRFDEVELVSYVG
jgi:hypothetical protein